MAAVAAQRGIDPEDALFDLAVAEEGRGPRFIHDYIEDDHYRTAPWPYCIFPSVDTGLFDPAQELDAAGPALLEGDRLPGHHRPVPAGAGPIRARGAPADAGGGRAQDDLPGLQRVGIADRGVIRPGQWADLVVFDKDTIALRGADADPARVETFYPVGIDYVAVNGQIAMKASAIRGCAPARCCASSTRYETVR